MPIKDDQTDWMKRLPLEQSGCYQKCASCSWIGSSPTDLNVCPECGGELEQDAVLVFGALLVYCRSDQFDLYYYKDRPEMGAIHIQAADAAETAAFIAKRSYKYPTSKRSIVRL